MKLGENSKINILLVTCLIVILIVSIIIDLPKYVIELGEILFH